MVDVVLVGGTATNGTDIDVYSTTTLTFLAFEEEDQCVTLTITDDMEIDEDETLIFELQNVTTGGEIGLNDSLVITIIDNDKLTCDAPEWIVVSPVTNSSFSNMGEWEPITGGYSANGFCGGGCAEQVETWLVYGPLDMTGVSLLELDFLATENFGSTTLDVQYSTESGATICPNEVAWTSVGTVEDSGNYTFDFGSVMGTEVYIGIAYIDDGADGYSDWELTDFMLSADVCPAVGEPVVADIDAGADVITCGLEDITLNGMGDGTWSGGAGSFDDTMSPNAVYTPDASEEGTTVVLTYTLNVDGCTGVSDDVNLVFLEEPGDAEFSYGDTDICPNGMNPLPMHTTGEDGIYTVTMGDASMIDLDPNTGEIDLANTTPGTYEITNTIAGGGNLMISGVIDGPLTGGQPKAIEFYALDYIPDLSTYGFGSANNGGGTDGEEFTFPAISVNAGEYIYLADNFADFTTFFGFEPDFVDAAAAINGDDALELFFNGVRIDLFGDVDVDGSGEAWEYLDGWAYRNTDEGLNFGNFDVANWTFSGPNALDNETTNATAATPFPIGSFTTTATGICPNNSFSVTLTVGDTTPPEIDCPNDIIVGLEPGDCNELVTYSVSFTDNCGMIDAEMSQAVNEMLINDALDCTNNTSNHLRYFENTVPVDVQISQVNFGVFASGANETVTVNIYSIMPAVPFVYANMNLVATEDVAIPSGMNNSIISAPIEATIPVGMNYVLELKANNTTNFVIGYNNQGETGSTYISGNNPVPCVSLEPTDIDGLGFAAFAVVLFSDAQGGPSIEQTEGLPSGVYYEIGTTTNTFVVTDVFGNTSECSFDVIVNEFANPVSSLTCNDNINLSLNPDDCTATINADMLLEGGPYGCYDDFIITLNGIETNFITEPGEYMYVITDPDTGNQCMGMLNVESKADPVIDCSAALCPLDMLQGEWTEEDGTFSPGAAWAFDGFAPNANILYDVIEFVVEVPGDYTFTMTPSDEFDGIAGIYAGSFDPLNPAENLIGGDDDTGGVFETEPDFTIFLEAGTYFLVSSTWGAGQMGAYSWTFSGPGDLLAECMLKCYELDALLSGELELPEPAVSSCIPYELFYSDNVETSDCGTTVVTRTYVAVNANGTTSCDVTYEIEPLSVALDIELPISPVEMTCGSGTSPEEIVAYFDNPLTTDNPNTSIVENNEGYPYAYPVYYVNGHAQKIDNNVCNIYAGYTDQTLDACEVGCNGNSKVIRTWSIVDWCTLDITTYIQTIKSVDTEAPTLITKDITISTNPWGCEADFEVPLPWELHDNCDYAPRYVVTGPAGVIIEGTMEEGFTALNAPKGVHTFYYVAYDCCGNEASYPFTVTVLDQTPPVVVTKQNIVIGLTSGATSPNGFSKLYAESVDNGSYDGCTDVKLEIRRDDDACDVSGNDTYNADGHPQDGSPNPLSPSYDPDGCAYVKFCCADLTNATVDVNGDGELDPGYVMVWLRVWDDGDMDGTFGSDGDNYNESWTYVKVEDKLSPTIQCPADITITCADDYEDTSITGVATAYGSCGATDVEYNDIIVNLNTCNEGFVRRRWNVVGRSDIFCDQTITLEGIESEVSVSFSQVGDFTAAGCPDDISVGEPSWIAGPCDVLGYTVDTDTFYFEDGACYKLVNYYTVINWCDYEPNSPTWNGEGIWEHTQIIKVTDETKPVIENCEPEMYAVNDHTDSDNDGNVCEAKVTLTNVATDEGSENCPTSWLKWTVLVDLWGDGTTDLEYSSFLPPFDSQFNDTNGNGIPDRYVAPTANGETVSIPLPDIEGSMSNHKVTWKVTDGCLNNTTCETTFMVVDKKAPTPYCIDVSTAVMDETNTVDLWASDFNIGSFDNCTAEENLRYTFTNVAPEDDPNYDEDLRSSSMTFDCNDVANSPVEVNMYVWDEKGNADFCVVYLTIIGACEDGMTSTLSGEIETESGKGVMEVEVTANSVIPEFPMTRMTDVEGMYAFNYMPQNVNYELSGKKDVDYTNGVSTLDLVKIQRHILGIEGLNSPYKVIAADVNGDESLKASDLLELRKLILGVITDLPNNESWRFVDAEQEFADIDNPWPIEESIQTGMLQSDQMAEDFIAVKIGDVTENANTNLTETTSEVRSAHKVGMVIEDREVSNGEMVEVTFSAAELNKIYGYQFTLELNGLNYVSVSNGEMMMTEQHLGMLDNNIMTVSYNEMIGKEVAKGSSLFTMVFEANREGRLSDMMAITSKVTSSEAYISDALEIREVELNVANSAIAYENELHQNEPNPFKEKTIIGYTLANTGSTTITVMDITGKIMLKRNIMGYRGYNEIAINASDLGASGVMYYQIESGEFTATKKMIMVK